MTTKPETDQSMTSLTRKTNDEDIYISQFDSNKSERIVGSQKESGEKEGTEHSAELTPAQPTIEHIEENVNIARSNENESEKDAIENLKKTVISDKDIET